MEQEKAYVLASPITTQPLIQYKVHHDYTLKYDLEINNIKYKNYQCKTVGPQGRANVQDQLDSYISPPLCT